MYINIRSGPQVECVKPQLRFTTASMENVGYQTTKAGQVSIFHGKCYQSNAPIVFSFES